MITYTIRTNVKGTRRLETDAVFTTGDVQAYRLQFVFYDNGVYDTTGCSLLVKGKRPDGIVIIDEGVIDELGNAFYDVKSSMYAVAGNLLLEVALLTANGGYITVKELTISVREGFGEGQLAEDAAPLLTELQKTLTEAKEITEKARPIGDIVATEEERASAEIERLKAEGERILSEQEREQAEGTRAAAETHRIANEEVRIANEAARVQAEQGRIAAENERQAGYEQMQGAFAGAVKCVASGSSIYLPDSADCELLDLSADDETAKIYVTGNNLFKPTAVTAASLVYQSDVAPNLSYAKTKNDYGTRINSVVYDNDVGIIAIQEDTKADNVTPVENVLTGFFYIYFDDSAHYQFNQTYTFVADVEVLENLGTEDFFFIVGASGSGQKRITLESSKCRLRIPMGASYSNIYPNRRCIEIKNRGKSMVFKNIMWLPGEYAVAPDYEAYKEQVITGAGDYQNIRTYYPVTRIVNDKETTVSVRYIADTKNYIDNKFAELQQAILSTGGNV